MNRNRMNSFFHYPAVLCMALAVLLSAGLANAQPQEELPATWKLSKLEVSPGSVKLNNRFEYAQIMLTATLESGERVDVTRMASISGKNEILRISPGGLIRPLAAGKTDLQFRVGGKEVRLPVEVVSDWKDYQVDYVRDVTPALSKAGCNAGTCHGSKEGKNGFKLSLRGYDPLYDHRALTDDLGARRIDRASPANSLMLLKATGVVPHVGGQLFKQDSEYYEILRAWIASGSRLDLSTPRVTSIEIQPLNPVVQQAGSRQQMRVMATYADGSSRDVTADAFITSGNLDVATVDKQGLVTVLRRGEAPMLARFEGRYTATTVTVMGNRSGFAWKEPGENNYIDKYVAQKLQRTKTLASPLCSDEDFLRRIRLDLTGLPPTVEEIESFLSDTRPSKVKRDAKIDQLVGSADYVEHWTNKWADLLQVNRKYLSQSGAITFRNWIQQAIASNTPYDEFAYSILTASGSNRTNPPASYYKILRDPEETMENTTHLFLAVRFNCNKCHDHPFERWTQDQYYELSAFFAQVGLKKDPKSGKTTIGGTRVEGAKPLYEVIYDKNSGEMKHQRTGEVTPPKFPYDHQFTVAKGASRREQLARWITSSNNRYFAKSYVNRLWGYLLGVGIIEPIDDIRAGNPPSNPELLDRLVQEFIASDFDVQELIRAICKSQAYQRSVKTNQWNKDDTINYSHALARRLPAEVLYDAVHRVTGSQTKLPGLPRGMRAAQIPDSGVKLPSGFLDQFGRPPRESACECERTSGVLLGPVMALVNGPTIAEAIADPGNAIAKLVDSEKDDKRVVNQLFLRILNRPATEQEIAAGVNALHAAAGGPLAAAKELEAYEATLSERIAKWEEQREQQIEWTPLAFEGLSSSVGAKLTLQKDNAVLAEGKLANDTYVLTAISPLAKVTAFRLEALTDNRLESKGPGRATNGNFVLGKFRAQIVAAKSPEKPIAIGLQNAQATYSQSGYAVASAIDGKIARTGNGWAIHPETGKNQTALFEVSKVTTLKENARLQIEMEFPYSDGQHNLGRFRISVTDAPQPVVLKRQDNPLGQILNIPREKRTRQQQDQVVAHFKSTDSTYITLKTRVEKLNQLKGQERLLGAQDLAWALINSPAFLFNH